MEKAEDIQKQLRELFATQSLAVLATHNEEQPYASLVAFVATDDLKHIYFVTPKTTRKFANLAADGRVALLINSSTNQSSDFHQAIAVTAVGDAEEIDRDRPGTAAAALPGQTPLPGGICQITDLRSRPGDCQIVLPGQKFSESIGVSSRQMKWILTAAEVAPDDRSRVGGKGYALAAIGCQRIYDS